MQKTLPTEINKTTSSAVDAEPKTLVEMYARALVLHNKPNTLNYKSGGEWHSISAKDFLSRVRNIAAGLSALGMQKGDRAAILSESCPQWTMADAGCLFSGVIDVPIYPTLTPDQIVYILKDSGARILFLADPARSEKLKECLARCDSIEHMVVLNSDGALPEGVLSLEQLEQMGVEKLAGDPSTLAELESEIKPDDLATIIYTSGTTGEPKGVMLSHSNLTSNLVHSSGHLYFGESDIALSVLPLSHVLERLAMYMYLYHGMTVFYAESIDRIGKNLLEVRPTILICVPRLFEKIYGAAKDKAVAAGKLKSLIFTWAINVGKDVAKRQVEHQPVPSLLELKRRLADKLVFHKWRAAMGGRIRLFVSGGAALSDEIALIFLGAGLQIVQGYGLTETSPVIAAGSPVDNRIGTVGKPIQDVEVRIAQDGEIETRGPNVMRGYFNKPEETRAVFTDDGWFRTGDIGTLDADGFLRITDRKKELFKTSGGKYIAPQPIEQLIKQSRFVNQVVLIGNGRKFPAALIVPDWTQMRAYADFKGLKLSTPAEFCKDARIVDLFQRQVEANTASLAQYEKVKKVALLEKEMTITGGELTPTLKVKRRIVDEKYKDVIDRIYGD